MKHYALTILFFGLLMGLLPAHPTAAHGGITIDGDASDWGNLGNGSCPPAPAVNSGQVLTLSHTDCGLGANAGTEYVWTDASGDQRTDHWGGTGNMDLTQFRITADTTNIYFLLRFSDITNCNAQYIAIAIDSAPGGTTPFPDNAETDAPFQYQNTVVANTTKTGRFTDATTFVAGGSSFCSVANNIWEISMPIADLGITWPQNSGDVEFAVAIFCREVDGTICEAFGSDAMDVITTTGPNTWDEVQDGTLSYAFTMGFSPTAVTLSQQHATPAHHTIWVIATAVLLLALATHRRLRHV